MMLCVKDLWSIFDRICVKKCGREAILAWTIKANGTVVADTSFTMSAGETVRIRANYSPENASLDFGLVDSNEKFHYINVTTGSIDKTIEIPENGSYTLVIRNNSSKSVKVTGIVTY